jgi:hypothetical protein
VAEVAVCTAVTESYDYLRADVFNEGYDYWFFTDEESQDLAGPTWRRASLPEAPDPRRRAKLPKINPHACPELSGYKYVIWVDGDIYIRSPSFVEEILSYLNNGMVISPHFDGRDCAYGEAEIRPPKYYHEPLTAQAAYYRSRGFPEHYGLYENGVLARNMESPMVAELGALWYSQVMRWSYQDQVSLPYCLWRLDYQPDVLSKSFRYMDWVLVNGHQRED